MQSMLTPKPSDDPHDIVAIAPDAIRMAPADEEIESLLKEKVRAPSASPLQAAPDLSASATVPPVDITFRATAGNRRAGNRFAADRRSRQPGDQGLRLGNNAGEPVERPAAADGIARWRRDDCAVRHIGVHCPVRLFFRCGVAVRAACRFGLDRADSLLEGRALIRDLGVRQGRLTIGESSKECPVGTVIEVAACIDGIVRQPCYGSRKQVVITVHQRMSLEHPYITGFAASCVL